MTVEFWATTASRSRSAKTAPDGRVNFRLVRQNEHERETPVVYVARLGDDVTFIPYSRDDRMLDFSRFDIDGVKNVSPTDLDAFVFTERGVYRPGDEMHIGCMVKQRTGTGSSQVYRSKSKCSMRAICRRK